ncbi:MAG: CoA activase [Chloroflexota bacterium]|nr:CoA activase [Chloroflexota bacterium]
MITAGIDMGAKTTKVVILKDDQVVARSLVLTGFAQQEAADKAMAEALAQVKIARGDIQQIVATGAGRKAVSWIKENVTEVSADARAIAFLHPNVRTLIDVGAEEGRAIKCTPQGKVADFVVNEKCAAGAGTFVEAMARALELKTEEMGELSLKSTTAVPMNAQCAVFAESEVVSLIHAQTPKPDIVRAVHDAIASRITSMARRIGVEKDIALIGGVAHNVGFRDALQRGLEVDVLVPADPEFVGALGAALIAKENS